MCAMVPITHLRQDKPHGVSRSIATAPKIRLACSGKGQHPLFSKASRFPDSPALLIARQEINARAIA